MDIEAKKLFLIQQLLLVKQETILDKIESLLKTNSSNLTSEQKNAIDKALISSENNNKVSHKDAIKELSNKFPQYFN